MRRIIVSIIFFSPFCCCLWLSTIAMVPTAVNKQRQIQKAIQLSSMMQNNITAAYDACNLWEDILLSSSSSSSEKSRIDNDKSILVLCQAMFASCLVRVGQDETAITVYNEALENLNNNINNNIKRDILHGKAQAYQRLLRYRNAKENYQNLIVHYPKDKNIQKFVLGAVNCCLRLNEVTEGQQILEDYCSSISIITNNNDGNDDENHQDWKSVQIMLKLLQYLDSGIPSDIIAFLEATITSSSSKDNSSLLLHQWIYNTLSSNNNKPETTHAIRNNVISTNAFLNLIKINLSPLDDASLLTLDDKVNLHKLLTETSNASTSSDGFWPEGMILPLESKRLQEHIISTQQQQQQQQQLWISKKRAGYGSHGNQIVTIDQGYYQDMMTKKYDGDGGDDDEYLLQKVIEPSSLIGGCKFSLRIYVVYFSPYEVYLSTEGLVKVASIPILSSTTTTSDEDDSARVYMTNSGREENMVQKGLEYLQETIFSNKDDKDDDGSSSSNYQQFWSQIRMSVRHVFDALENNNKEQLSSSFSSSSSWNQRREALCIPKIMGFDYVVDDNKRPWLIEINRFPGLEPRDESDQRIKYRVVRDAWICANEKRKRLIQKDQLLQHQHPLEETLKHLESVIGDTGISLERV